jgi:Holliday junction resolvasome RuvABC DNA-binding subunit
VGGFKGEADAIEALKSLGYAEREARDVLKKVPRADKDGGAELSTGEKVKRALKILSAENNNK